MMAIPATASAHVAASACHQITILGLYNIDTVMDTGGTMRHENGVYSGYKA